MPGTDAALFARLKALRSPSAASSEPMTSTTDASSRAAALEDRFRKLRLASSKGDTNFPSVSEEDRFIDGLRKAPESEDIAQTAAALDADKDVGMSDFPEVRGLLREAQTLTGQHHGSGSVEGPSPPVEEAHGASTHGRSKSEDSELASEYIQQVLDELKATCLDGEADAEEQEDGQDKEREAGHVADEYTGEEKTDEAESPLLDLPSVPSGRSTQATPSKDTAEMRWDSIGKDDDDSTWCVICCDDATIKCLGCDGDLYCSNCWREGHRSEDAGLEERTHKAVLYQKPGKKKQKMMAA
jgi:hypothetical protein